jgi:hypothetical protein
VVAEKGHEASGGRTNATGSNQHNILVTALKRAGVAIH